MNDTDQAEAMAAVEKIKPLLAGKHPAVQGMAIVELMAIWLAGHPEDTREKLLALSMVAVEGLANQVHAVATPTPARSH